MEAPHALTIEEIKREYPAQYIEYIEALERHAEAIEEERDRLKAENESLKEYRFTESRRRAELYALRCEDKHILTVMVDRLKAENAEARKALQATIPCLEDWIATTGFGSVNRRDRDALKLAKAALAGKDHPPMSNGQPVVEDGNY